MQAGGRAQNGVGAPPEGRYTGDVKLTLTERAADAVRSRAREAEVTSWLLRVAVVAGGCNGLTYDLYFVPDASAQDELIESAGVRVAVDPSSAPMLDGTVIDLADARSFRFLNPRARRGCSCGASFEV
jgi:iron-sulfur cluster assembly protein